jgi:hypothetical protein
MQNLQGVLARNGWTRGKYCYDISVTYGKAPDSTTGQRSVNAIEFSIS